MVLYRKYRPQTLDELDSTIVRERLIKVFSSSFIPHAFLFSGTRGTGKTSAARIIAKILNCEKNTKNKEQITKNKENPQVSIIGPCNVCETCRAITDGRFLDVIEIDAASNRGIEEIRDLREKIKLAPVSGKYKVYIIDEVHMLTNEAFNALLKTLEEPPLHAVFILATTEIEKLPETIVSRCIKFHFQRASREEVFHCLTRVVKGEKIKITDEMLEVIAQNSDGSFRDATKILEQAVSEGAKDLEKLNIMLGRYNISLEKFLKLLSAKNTKEILSEIENMDKNGANFRILTEEILHILHDLLLAQYGLDKEKVKPEIMDLFTRSEINSLIKIFSKVYIDIKYSNISYLPLELAAVEWCEKGGAYV